MDRPLIFVFMFIYDLFQCLFPVTSGRLLVVSESYRKKGVHCCHHLPRKHIAVPYAELKKKLAPGWNLYRDANPVATFYG